MPAASPTLNSSKLISVSLPVEYTDSAPPANSNIAVMPSIEAGFPARVSEPWGGRSGRPTARPPAHRPAGMLRAMAEQHYLAGLDLAGRRVVVVGGGTVAQRRLPRLVAAGARVEVVAPEATPAVQAMADNGEITWHQRPYAPGDLADAWYVVSCASVTEVNAAVSEEAERSRVFCVRADAGTEGSAVTPAVGDHDGLLIG